MSIRRWETFSSSLTHTCPSLCQWDKVWLKTLFNFDSTLDCCLHRGNTGDLFKHSFIHPSIHHHHHLLLLPSHCGGSRNIPDISLLSNKFQLLREDPKVFPGQMAYIIPAANSGSTTCPEDLQRCPAGQKYMEPPPSAKGTDRRRVLCELGGRQRWCRLAIGVWKVSSRQLYLNV